MWGSACLTGYIYRDHPKRRIPLQVGVLRVRTANGTGIAVFRCSETSNLEREGSGVTGPFNRKLYRLQAQIAKALAHPLRLEILDRLGEGEVSFGALQEQLRVLKPNLSQHLGIMRGAGIVIDRRAGSTTYYRLAYPEILDACRSLAETVHSHLSGGARLARAAKARSR